MKDRVVETKIGEGPPNPEKLIEKIVQANTIFADTTTGDKVFEGLLESLVELTGSEYGFLDALRTNSKGRLSRLNLAIYCSSENPATCRFCEDFRSDTIEFGDLDNLAGYPAKTGTPIIVNDRQNHPNAQKLPKGHPPLDSFMGVPLYFGKELVGVAGVANRQGGYSRSLLGAIEPFLSTCSSVLFGRRARRRERKQLEALERSNQMLSAMLEVSPESTFLIDKNGTVLKGNSVFAQRLGKSLEDLIGTNIFDILPEDVSIARKTQLTKLLLEGSISSFEDRRDHRIFSIRAFPLEDKNGNIERIAVFGADITEQRKAEAELHESQEVLRAVLDSIPVRVFWKDKDFNYLGCNVPFAKDAGENAPSDIVGKNDYELAWKKLADLYRRDDREVLSSGKEKLQFEEPLVIPSGETHHLLTSKVPLRNAKGEVTGILGTYLDITARKKAEAALKETQDKYKEIFERSRDGFVLVTPEGKIEGANKAYCTMLGYSLDELRQLESFYEITPRKWWQWEEEEIWKKRLLKRGHSGVYEKEYIRKNGTVFPVELQSYTVWNNDGTIRYLWGVARDISARVRNEKAREKLEDQLAHSRKMESIGRLAGGVAHDFNNLLTGIMGNSSLGLMEISPHDPLRNHLEEISKAAESAAELTKQLLAFSRKQVLEPRVIDLEEHLDKMQRMLRRLMGEDIRFLYRADGPVGNVLADPGQIEQVIVNLAVNARDAMPHGGDLEIRVGRTTLSADEREPWASLSTGEYVKITVRDTGEGMKEEDKALVFEPFFTTKQEGEGTGLGLATVYGIVTQHKGAVAVDSVLGHGTTFTVLLPRSAASATARKVRKDLNFFRGNETVLLVEDDAMVRRVAFDVLCKLGYDVHEADSGKAALQLLENGYLVPDILLTDIIMPGMNGHELAEHMTARFPKMKVLYSSGYTSNFVSKDGPTEKELNILNKPYDPGKLSKAVRRVLDRENP